MKVLCASLVVFFGLQSVALTDDLWKIIGEDNLVTVNAQADNIPLQYKKIVNAFGFMNVGCTATHIGRGIVITAGHCFFALNTLVKNADCDDVTIDWGMREGVQPYMQSKCQKILYMQNDTTEVDFAILRVSPIPKTKVELDLTNPVQAGDTVTVFSHPDDLPLRWSQSCQVLDQPDAQLPRLSLKHNCDTNGGSSGATMLNPQTLKIVAIHNGGRLDGTTTNGLNYGTPITNKTVVEALRRVGF